MGLAARRQHKIKMATAEELGLTEQQMVDYKEAFDMFDEDKSGSVDENELEGVMKALGLNPTAAQIKGMIKEVDVDGNDTIEFEEFCKLMNAKVTNVEPLDDLVAA